MNPHCLGRYVTSDHLPLVEEMLRVFGETIRFEERLMNAATALTAVGPTYILPVIKALKEAAIGKGLSENDAQFAAAQTVFGTGQLVLETREDPDVLKLMIGTRTLKEEEARVTFAAAFEAAFEKISASEKKLSP
jgi:pyrroline-5-carboxylate reductase